MIDMWLETDCKAFLRAYKGLLIGNVQALKD